MKIDAGKIIDDSNISKLHFMVIAIGMFVLVIDSYDLVSIGLIIPLISEEWGMQPSDFSVALSVSMFGVLLGSTLAGVLGDYIGRHKTMLITVSLAGVSMLLTTRADNMTELVIYRFFTGLSAGGCIPITIAYASEYMPLRLRNRLVVLMYTGAGLGAVFASLAAPTIMAYSGWEGIFYVGSALTILVFPFIYFLLPESLKFLISQKVEPSVAAKLLTKVDSGFVPKQDDVYFISEHTNANTGSPVRELFGGDQTTITLIAWGVMIGNQFMVFLIALWLPTLLITSGIALETSLYIAASYHFGGVIGGIIFSSFADKLGTGKVLTFTYPVAGITVATLGFSLDNIYILAPVAVISGIFLIGSAFCLAPYVASMYPTRGRSTGLGWALGIGRIGSILSPLAAGYALSLGYEISFILLIAGIPPLICGLLVFKLDKLTQKLV